MYEVFQVIQAHLCGWCTMLFYRFIYNELFGNDNDYVSHFQSSFGFHCHLFCKLKLAMILWNYS